VARVEVGAGREEFTEMLEFLDCFKKQVVIGSIAVRFLFKSRSS
jgi:hypothetical protein